MVKLVQRFPHGSPPSPPVPISPLSGSWRVRGSFSLRGIPGHPLAIAAQASVPRASPILLLPFEPSLREP